MAPGLSRHGMLVIAFGASLASASPFPAGNLRGFSASVSTTGAPNASEEAQPGIPLETGPTDHVLSDTPNGAEELNTISPAPISANSGDASSYTFYVYRAQGSSSYPPKNVNAANLPGVMWYLQNEVVIQDPPKFGIQRILRYKVSTKAPAGLLVAGMNFGVRYAYDSGKCTGPDDCDRMYRKYGYFVGCNRFESNYPFPTEETNYPGGIWYSFPGNGTVCLEGAGSPTGADDCTYTYSWPPAELTIDELVGGDWQGFFADRNNESANAEKVAAAAELFRAKYPDSELLDDPDCDFDYGKFW